MPVLVSCCWDLASDQWACLLYLYWFNKWIEIVRIFITLFYEKDVVLWMNRTVLKSNQLWSWHIDIRLSISIAAWVTYEIIRYGKARSKMNQDSKCQCRLANSNLLSGCLVIHSSVCCLPVCSIWELWSMAPCEKSRLWSTCLLSSLTIPI